MRLFRGNASLRFLETSGCGLTTAQLQRIADAFGPLSNIGRKRLFLGVIQALEKSWRKRFDKSPAGSRLAEHFRGIESRANELLKLVRSEDIRSREGDESENTALETESQLGVHLAKVLIERRELSRMWMSLLSAYALPAEGIVVAGEIDGSPIGIAHRTALNLVTIMIASLAEAASLARADAIVAVKPGRGGTRRKGRTPSSELAVDLIHLYFGMRRRYPESGSARGYSPGGPLSRFVLAVFDAARESAPSLRRITDASIGTLFYEVRKSIPNVE